MNYLLAEEQQLLQKMAREFFEREFPSAVLRETWDSQTAYSAKLWKQMAELGWLGLGIPDKYGGSDGTCLDLAVLYEEMGRASFLSPHLSTVIICGQAILAAGSEEQKRAYLPAIAQGKAVWALALVETSAGWDAASVAVTGKKQDDSFIINGAKLFVNYASSADYLLCVVRTGGAKGEDGIALLAVPAKAAGVTCNPLKTIGRGAMCEVQFDNVKVGKENVLGLVGQGWPLLERGLQMGAVMQSAEMVGGARRSLDFSVDFAKQRVQFGRPVGSFQAVQQRSADMAKDVEAAGLMTLAAAWELSKKDSARTDVSMAKAFANQACRRVLYGAHHTLAGTGYTLDHDLHIYTQRGAGGEQMLGDTRHHLEAIAREMGL